MPLTSLEAELRAIARERIAQHLLPYEVPATMWGGVGSGQACSLCDKPIGNDQLEFEYALDNRSYRFHRLCHGIWQVECERVAYLAKHPAAAAAPADLKRT